MRYRQTCSATQDSRGFTLVEVVIAIFALALISGFILQMFIVSSKINQKAQDIDGATMQAISIIETFKGQQEAFDLARSPMFDGAHSVLESSTLTLTHYYDLHWKPLNSLGPTPRDALFCSVTKIVADAETEANRYSMAFYANGGEGGMAVSGSIYKIEVQVFRLPSPASGINGEPLITLHALHYFNEVLQRS